MALSGHVEHIEVISDTEATGTDTATDALTEATDGAGECSGSDSDAENVGAELKEYPMYNRLGHELSCDVGEMIAGKDKQKRKHWAELDKCTVVAMHETMGCKCRTTLKALQKLTPPGHSFEIFSSLSSRSGLGISGSTIPNRHF
eukprot:1726510-Rhodomonas_salina.1